MIRRTCAIMYTILTIPTHARGAMGRKTGKEIIRLGGAARHSVSLPASRLQVVLRRRDGAEEPGA